MRERIAETGSLLLCIALLVIIPLVVAVIVASPFAIYHVILRGWEAGWIDLMESSRFIGYFWALMVGAALLWTLVTYLLDRRSLRSDSD
ncbi:MAG: hypothetical protein V4671_04205 [Armatimonadota bacterium]